ncbi:hypothetical protein QJS66_12140 [Kocuria rhizophila]|nr:hypothetical protein QJS66_12140 [Kocuria rhizophila]
MAAVAAQTERIQLSTATTLITTTDPVRIRRTTRTSSTSRTAAWTSPWDAATPARSTRGSAAASVGHPAGRENCPLLRRLWREEGVNFSGRFRTPLQGFTSTPRPLDDIPTIRVARLHPLPRRSQKSSGVLQRQLSTTTSQGAHRAHGGVLPPALRCFATAPQTGDRGLGRCFMARNSQDARCAGSGHLRQRAVSATGLAGVLHGADR